MTSHLNMRMSDIILDSAYCFVDIVYDAIHIRTSITVAMNEHRLGSYPVYMDSGVSIIHSSSPAI